MLKQEKRKLVENLVKMFEEYKVIGLLNMHKIPAKQLQKIRDNLRGTALIKMTKKTLIKKALENTKKANLKILAEKIEQEPALIFTNINPFSLFKTLKGIRTPAAAKEGDIAPYDITIKKAATDLPAGPSISGLQKVGLKTKIQNGKIHIVADKKVLHAGEKITKDIANAFNLLKMEPMEIGLNIVIVFENGILYERSVLDIDIEEYIKKVETCLQHAINLSMNINYPTDTTINLMIQKSFMDAKALCIGANIIEKEFIDDILLKAITEEKKLEEHLGGK